MRTWERGSWRKEGVELNMKQKWEFHVFLIVYKVTIFQHCFDAIRSSPVRLGSPQPGRADVLWLRRGLRSSRQLQRCHGGHGKHYCLQTGTKLLSGPHLSASAWRGQHYFPIAGWSKKESLKPLRTDFLAASRWLWLPVFTCLHHLASDPSVFVGFGNPRLAPGRFLLRLPVHTDSRRLPVGSLRREPLPGPGRARHSGPHHTHRSSRSAGPILALCSAGAGGHWRGEWVCEWADVGPSSSTDCRS